MSFEPAALVQCLADLTSERRGARELAASRMLDWLRARVAGRLRPSKTEESLFADEQDREEIVANVMLKLLSFGPNLPEPLGAEATVGGYLARMLANTAVDFVRARRREPLTVDGGEQVPDISAGTEQSGAGDLGAAQVTALATVEAMSARLSLTDGDRMAWSELRAMVFFDRSLEDALLEGRAVERAAASPEVWVKARNQALTRHKRFRFKLRDLLEGMDEGDPLRGPGRDVLELLFRRQKGTKKRV